VEVRPKPRAIQPEQFQLEIPGLLAHSEGLSSAGEQVASWAPCACVFKTLNTTGAGNMAKAGEYPVKPLMLVAGDDAARKVVVMELVGMLGFEPVDAGPLKNARLLEPFAMIWIDQAMKSGRGRDFAFALVKIK
jgi:8-hydroxy-5-deazaflavin:NADPH oxidoreductase